MSNSRVLIVDDDPALLQALPEALRLRMGEVIIDTCDSAACALDYIDRTDYDAIVSDIKMPGMDGLALLSAVRDRRPDTPTLLITGHGEHDLAVQALRGGAYDFVQKPIDREYFVASLNRAIRTRQLSRQLEEHQIAMAEMRVAREIQQRLFPTSPPEADGYDFAGASLPASETGGDYYDYFPMLEGGVGAVVGDVSGHGFGPALLMADTRAYLRALATTCGDVGEILTRANDAVALDTADNQFVTLLFARIDAQRRTLTYASAGHNTGYIVGPSGDVRHPLESTDLPLGINSAVPYHTSPAIELLPGDIIFMLTDGVVEASSSSGEHFGFDRALDVVRQNRHKSASEVILSLCRAVQNFAHGRPQRDDITALVIKIG